MSSDHTDAATITPEAKPSRTFCTIGGISRFMKNTKAEPRAVPDYSFLALQESISKAVTQRAILFMS